MARPRQKRADRKLAGGYIRVSTGRQAQEGISLEHQRDVIESYCKLHGLKLHHVVVDAGNSAYKQPLDRRTEGMRIMEMIDERQVGAVVALRLDRLFRSIQDCINSVMAWDKAGVALHLVSMGGLSVDTSTPMGRMLITLMAGFAEMESFQKAERARDAWEYKMARGERLGGKPPFGYRLEGHRPVPVEAEQLAIDRIVNLSQQGISVAMICRNLEREGHEPRGSRWHSKTVVRILGRAIDAPERAAGGT